MTVESTSRKQVFAGGQGTLSFSFRTLAAHPEYIKVVEKLTSTGAETALTYGVDYTVSLSADGVGGTVIVSPSYSTAYTQTVYRDTDDLQESDYDDFNQFPADTLEDDLDRRTLISQERSEDSDRTAKLPISSTVDSVTLPNPQDGLILGWSGTSGTLSNYTVASLNAIVVDTDVTLTANSDSRVASQKATKSYVDNRTGGVLSLNVLFDGGGSVLSTGSVSYLDVLIPFNCTILESTIVSTTSGSMTVDIWKATYPGIPTIGNTIVASAKPTLSSALVSRDFTLTGWTTAIPSDSTLRFSVSTSSLVVRATLHLKLRKTSL